MNRRVAMKRKGAPLTHGITDLAVEWLLASPRDHLKRIRAQLDAIGARSKYVMINLFFRRLIAHDADGDLSVVRPGGRTCDVGSGMDLDVDVTRRDSVDLHILFHALKRFPNVGGIGLDEQIAFAGVTPIERSEVGATKEKTAGRQLVKHRALRVQHFRLWRENGSSQRHARDVDCVRPAIGNGKNRVERFSRRAGEAARRCIKRHDRRLLIVAVNRGNGGNCCREIGHSRTIRTCDLEERWRVRRRGNTRIGQKCCAQ